MKRDRRKYVFAAFICIAFELSCKVAVESAPNQAKSKVSQGFRSVRSLTDVLIEMNRSSHPLWVEEMLTAQAPLHRLQFHVRYFDQLLSRLHLELEKAMGRPEPYIFAGNIPQEERQRLTSKPSDPSCMRDIYEELGKKISALPAPTYQATLEYTLDMLFALGGCREEEMVERYKRLVVAFANRMAPYGFVVPVFRDINAFFSDSFLANSRIIPMYPGEVQVLVRKADLQTLTPLKYFADHDILFHGAVRLNAADPTWWSLPSHFGGLLRLSQDIPNQVVPNVNKPWWNWFTSGETDQAAATRTELSEYEVAQIGLEPPEYAEEILRRVEAWGLSLDNEKLSADSDERWEDLASYLRERNGLVYVEPPNPQCTPDSDTHGAIDFEEVFHMIPNVIMIHTRPDENVPHHRLLRVDGSLYFD